MIQKIRRRTCPCTNFFGYVKKSLYKSKGSASIIELFHFSQRFLLTMSWIFFFLLDDYQKLCAAKSSNYSSIKKSLQTLHSTILLIEGFLGSIWNFQNSWKKILTKNPFSTKIDIVICAKKSRVAMMQNECFPNEKKQIVNEMNELTLKLI